MPTLLSCYRCWLTDAYWKKRSVQKAYSSGYNCNMRDTTIIEKFLPSALNAAVAFGISLPFLYFFGHGTVWKASTILAFYFIQIADTHEHLSFRCFGMRALGTVWSDKHSRLRRNIYSILYTLSFSTLLFWIYFPFDMFLINMLLLQLPTILLTGTTLHGLLAGNFRSKIKS